MHHKIKLALFPLLALPLTANASGFNAAELSLVWAFPSP